MSCQQVPRLTEDPYTFTEATSVSATLFNPQIHRLSPIFSSANTKTIVAQKAQIVSQQQRVVQQSPPTNQQQVSVSQQQQAPQQIQLQLSPQQVSPQPQKSPQSQQHSPQQKSPQVQQKSQTPSPQHLNHQKQQQTQQNQQQQKQQQSPSQTQQQQQQIQLQQIQQTVQQQSQQQQFLSSRINGLTAVVNGVHKNAIPVVSTATLSAKVQSQLQYPTAKITAVKFLQPPSPGTITVQQSHPLYSIAKQQQTTVSSAQLSTATLPLPPLFQRSSATPIQSSIIQQIELNQSQKNHSNASKLLTTPPSSISTATAIRVTQAFPGTTFTTYAPPPISLGQANPPLNVGVIRKTQIPLVKQVNTSNTNDAKTNAVENTKKKTSADASPPRQTPQPAPPPPPPPPPLPPTAAAPSTVDSQNGKTIFAAPAKKELKSTVAGSKKTPKLHSGPGSRTKRSYSQTAHHEALQRIPSSTSNTTAAALGNSEWHAPDSYVFDGVSPAFSYATSGRRNDYDIYPCVQTHWLNLADDGISIPSVAELTREQRIELRKAQLRRQALQYVCSQKFHSPINARRRLMCVAKALKTLRERDETPPPKKCYFPTCVNDALAYTAYCYLHITQNVDQHLFLPCTAKFSDNSQCRVPVFDISHELPLCREHAWKRDNYNRISQEQKPKKPPRKRPKPSAMTRPQKRSKKKRKQQSSASMSSTASLSTNYEQSDSQHQNSQQFDEHFFNDMKYEIKSEDDVNYVITQPPSQTISSYSTTQDMLSMCDNSSAYESSEDTGVGGLSETELMVGAQDVIEEIPLADTRLLEEHDLTNVLNQLPVDAFNELFTADQQNGPSEPTQEEQEDLERALEAVNKQVKSLTQMQQMIGGDTNFLGDFVDLDDQILDDTDICTEVVLRSPSSNSIEAGGVIIGPSSNDNSSCKVTTTADIRGLVQT